MSGKASSSDMNPPGKESKILGRCLEEDKCLDSLHLLVDGEATMEEEEYFMNHLQNCMPCYNLYNLEKTVKCIVQSKIKKKAVPPSLLNSIRNKLKGNTETA